MQDQFGPDHRSLNSDLRRAAQHQEKVRFSGSMQSSLSIIHRVPVVVLNENVAVRPVAVSTPAPAHSRPGHCACVRMWLDNKIIWLVPHEDQSGCSSVFSEAAIQACLTIKALLYSLLHVEL